MYNLLAVFWIQNKILKTEKIYPLIWMNKDEKNEYPTLNFIEPLWNAYFWKVVAQTKGIATILWFTLVKGTNESFQMRYTMFP